MKLGGDDTSVCPGTTEERPAAGYPYFARRIDDAYRQGRDEELKLVLALIEEQIGPHYWTPESTVLRALAERLEGLAHRRGQ